MKILFYLFNPIAPECGGVERVASCQMEEFMKLGHKVYAIYFNEVKKLNTKDICNNQYQLPDRTSINSFRNVKFLEDFIRFKKIDVVLNLGAVNSNSSLGIVQACINSNIPLISVIHNTIDVPLRSFSLGKKLMQTRFGNYILRFMFKLLQYNPLYKGAYYIYTKSSATVVLSHSYIKEFRYLMPKINANNLYVISNPLTLKVDEYLNEKENIVLFVGRLTSQKSVDKLLDIWSSLPTNDWTLVIVGSGNKKEELKIQAQSMCTKIIFIENCDPIPYYKRAKIFCLTSIYEGYPMTLIECQAFGCVPIIYNSFPAANDVIKNDLNGYVITAFDKIRYQNKLWELMNDEKHLKQLSTNCIHESSKYSKEEIIKKWIDIIEKIVISNKGV